MKSTIRDDLHRLQGQLQGIMVCALDNARVSDAMENATVLLDDIITRTYDEDALKAWEKHCGLLNCS